MKENAMNNISNFLKHGQMSITKNHQCRENSTMIAILTIRTHCHFPRHVPSSYNFVLGHYVCTEGTDVQTVKTSA